MKRSFKDTDPRVPPKFFFFFFILNDKKKCTVVLYVFQRFHKKKIELYIVTEAHYIEILFFVV